MKKKCPAACLTGLFIFTVLFTVFFTTFLLSCKSKKKQPGEEKAKQLTTVQKDTLKFIGIAARTNNKQEIQGKGKISKLWQRFFKERIASKIPNKVCDSIYGIYYDYSNIPHGDYTCLIGCHVSKIDSIPEGMVAKTFPASKYAVFQSKRGNIIKVVIDAWHYIWGTWTQKTKHKRTYVLDFEEYGKDCTDTNNAIVKLFVSIK